MTLPPIHLRHARILRRVRFYKGRRPRGSSMMKEKNMRGMLLRWTPLFPLHGLLPPPPSCVVRLFFFLFVFLSPGRDNVLHERKHCVPCLTSSGDPDFLSPVPYSSVPLLVSLPKRLISAAAAPSFPFATAFSTSEEIGDEDETGSGPLFDRFLCSLFFLFVTLLGFRRILDPLCSSRRRIVEPYPALASPIEYPCSPPIWAYFPLFLAQRYFVRHRPITSIDFPYAKSHLDFQDLTICPLSPFTPRESLVFHSS